MLLSARKTIQKAFSADINHGKTEKNAKRLQSLQKAMCTTEDGSMLPCTIKLAITRNCCRLIAFLLWALPRRVRREVYLS